MVAIGSSRASSKVVITSPQGAERILTMLGSGTIIGEPGW
jgi:hypothetical protein